MVAANRNTPNVSRLRLPLLVLFAVTLLAFLSASGIARVYTDYLFFDSLNLSSVWSGILGTKSVLVVLFSLLFFVILYGNLYLASKTTGGPTTVSGPEELLDKYREMMSPYSQRVRMIVSAFLALLVGLRTSAEWERWILFRNGGDFGWSDPLFGRDAGFYVFRLPFWTFLVDWFTTAFLFALIAVGVHHYLNGSLRSRNVKAMDRVKIHLSLLLAALAMLRAFAYWLDRYELVTSTRGVFDGALATDVQIQLPAFNLLVLISIFGAGLFVANVWRDGWGLPVVAVVLWAVSHVVVGSVFPALYQRLRVVPVQSTRERPFVSDNMDATRFAYGFDEDSLEIRQFDYEAEISFAQIEENQELFDRIMVADPRLALAAFGRQQGETKYYQFAETAIDVDRYDINGESRSVLLSARGINPSTVANSWEDLHVVYTHGYGVAAARGDTVSEGGLPEYLVEGIGPDEKVEESLDAVLEQPRIYFGENFDGYAIVKADGRNELDFPASGEEGEGDEIRGGEYRYDGEGGIGMGGFFRRLSFSLRFQELNPLISGFVGKETEVIFNRDIEQRIRLAAPFLEFDSDPYPVVLDGRIQWIVDAYTTTDDFPYAQSVDTPSIVSGDLAGGYNYVRNSVKVVVDSFDGDVQMFIVDDEDPIVAAYAKAFPSLFKDGSQISPELQAHFRYPVDLFSVQTDMLDTYQVRSAESLIQNDSAWSVSTQPDGSAETENAPVSEPMRPQYATTQLPGEDELEFVIMRSFVPETSSVGNSTNRPEVNAFIYGRADGENRGKLVMYQFPQGQLSAPDFVDSDIKQNDAVSAVITPLGLQGSEVLFGEMVPLLVDNTVVYIRPMYVQAKTENGLPELNRIIAVNGPRIAMGFTLQEALAGVVVNPSSVSPLDGGSGDPTALDGLSVAELLSRSQELLRAAEVAQANGDTEEAKRLSQDAALALDRLARLLGVETAENGDSGEA